MEAQYQLTNYIPAKITIDWNVPRQVTFVIQTKEELHAKLNMDMPVLLVTLKNVYPVIAETG